MYIHKHTRTCIYVYLVYEVDSGEKSLQAASEPCVVATVCDVTLTLDASASPKLHMCLLSYIKTLWLANVELVMTLWAGLPTVIHSWAKGDWVLGGRGHHLIHSLVPCDQVLVTNTHWGHYYPVGEALCLPDWFGKEAIYLWQYLLSVLIKTVFGGAENKDAQWAVHILFVTVLSFVNCWVATSLLLGGVLCWCLQLVSPDSCRNHIWIMMSN